MRVGAEASWVTPRRPPVAARGRWRLAVLAAVLTALWTGTANSAPLASRSPQPSARLVVSTTVLHVPPGTNPSEAHLALDPEHPRRLYAVAQVAVPGLPLSQELLWRSRDGGRTWRRSGLLGFTDNSPEGLAGDPVVAAGRDGLVLYGTLALSVDDAAGTITEVVGTRVSTDAGRTFTAFGTAHRIVLPICAFTTCGPPSEFLDKEWLAVDATHGPFGGSAYLAWVHFRPDNTTQDLLFSVSRDGGKTYSRPLVLQRSVSADLAGLEEYAQLAVRPDGTVDAVWNGLRHGKPMILHAVSRNGGASFSQPTPIVRLDPAASRLGIVTSLAVSPSGRLAVCWSQDRPSSGYNPRISCTATDRTGRWRSKQPVLPHNHDRQYLPGATFQGERLWVALYVSDATRTRMLAIPNQQRSFGEPVTLNRWPVPSDRICAPHPPDCIQGQQTFIGDYIGAVATRKQVIVAYIEPALDPAANRVLVSRLAVERDGPAKP
jgi:hypothetical protein